MTQMQLYVKRSLDFLKLYVFDACLFPSNATNLN